MNFDFSKKYATRQAAQVALQAAYAALRMDLNSAIVLDDEIMIQELSDIDELSVYQSGDCFVIR